MARIGQPMSKSQTVRRQAVGQRQDTGRHIGLDCLAGSIVRPAPQQVGRPPLRKFAHDHNLGNRIVEIAALFAYCAKRCESCSVRLIMIVQVVLAQVR